MDGIGRVDPAFSSTNQFEVKLLSDGVWFIQSHRVDTANDITYLSYDGEDTYYVAYTETVMGVTNGRPAKIATRPLVSKKHVAYICNGSYPMQPFSSDVQFLWTVFAAGNYIRVLKTNSIPLPWAKPRWNLLAYGFRCETDLSGGSYHFPKQLRFVRDVGLDLVSDESEMSRPDLNKASDEDWLANWVRELNERKTLWTNDFVAAELSVAAITNFSGCEVPVSFSLKTFHPLFTEGRPRIHCYGTVTNVAAAEGFSLRPPIMAPLSVKDARFRFRDSTRQIDDLSYQLNPGQDWRSQNAKELQAEFSGLVRDSQGDERVQPASVRRRRIFIAFLFLSIGSALPLLIYRCVRQPSVPAHDHFTGQTGG